MDEALKLLDSTDIYKRILDHADEGVNVVDKTGMLIFVNKVSSEYCNSQPSEMIGRQIEDFYPNAMLLNVIRTKKAVLGEKIHFVGKKKYVCSRTSILYRCPTAVSRSESLIPALKSWVTTHAI